MTNSTFMRKRLVAYFPEPGHTRRPVGIRGLTRGAGVLFVGYGIALAGVGYVPDPRMWGFRGIGLALGSVLLLLTGFHVAKLAMLIRYRQDRGIHDG